MRTRRHLLLAALAIAPAACLDQGPADEALNDEVAPGEQSSELALGPTVVCTGTQTTTNTPGLLFLPQIVASTTITILAPCYSTDLSLASGIATTTPDGGARSCAEAGVPSHGVMTIEWNNGLTSGFTYNAVTSNVLGSQHVVSAGVIRTGTFEGHATTVSSFGLSFNPLACLAAPGLRAQSAVASLVIL